MTQMLIAVAEGGMVQAMVRGNDLQFSGDETERLSYTGLYYCERDRPHRDGLL